ncbi:HNH endonuclease [Herbiconiux ginsengi]|uniref:HNH endonuclease n=1 Tax=Herbiconiux ginsengi TaxID=381665 RepID=UPI001114D714|nr:HNH endonuclease [Herbiconiux ginsengi]
MGDEPRIAAWLAFNKEPGETFTTDELRNALGHRLSKTSRNDMEHFQRRIRQLRSIRDGWVFPSAKHDRNLDVGDYKLERIGWHPALGKRPKDKSKVTKKNKLFVLTRDHYRCFHCGIIAGEPYPDHPERTAVLTAGHIVAAADGGTGDPSNLRAECSDCNETARSDTRAPESLNSVQTSIDNLNNRDRKRLLEWVSAGQRGRDKVDEAYDRYRLLTPSDRSALVTHLLRTTKLQ